MDKIIEYKAIKRNDCIQDVNKFLNSTRFNFDYLEKNQPEDLQYLLLYYESSIKQLNDFLQDKRRVIQANIILSSFVDKTRYSTSLMDLCEILADEEAKKKSKKRKTFLEIINNCFKINTSDTCHMLFCLYYELFENNNLANLTHKYGDRTFWLQVYFDRLLKINPKFLQNFVPSTKDNNDPAQINSVIEDALLFQQDEELEAKVLEFLEKNITIAARKIKLLDRFRVLHGNKIHNQYINARLWNIEYQLKRL